MGNYLSGLTKENDGYYRIVEEWGNENDDCSPNRNSVFLK